MLRIEKKIIRSSKRNSRTAVSMFMVLIMTAVLLTGLCTGLPTDRVNAKEDAIPVYRIYNPNSGEHFYTINRIEKNNAVTAGWIYEGVGWFAPSSSKSPVYRLFNPNARDAGSHHYTMNAGERDSLVSAGWKYEGVVFYGDGNVSLHRAYNKNNGAHHYTTSEKEYNKLVSAGWNGEGVGMKAANVGCSYYQGDVDACSHELINVEGREICKFCGATKDMITDGCDHVWATGTAKEYVPEEGCIETYYIPAFMEVQSIYRGYDHCGCGKLWDTAEQAGDCHGHWSPRSIKIGEYNPNSDLIGKYIKIDEYTYTENIYDPDNKIWHDVTVVVSNTGAKYKKWEVDKKAYYKDVTYTYCTKCGKGTYHPAEGHLEKVVDQKGFEYISHPITDDGSEKQTLIFWCPFCNKKYTQAEVDKAISEYNNKFHDSRDTSCFGCLHFNKLNGTTGCKAEHLCWKYVEVKKTLPEQSHKVWVVDKAAYYEGGKVD